MDAVSPNATAPAPFDPTLSPETPSGKGADTENFPVGSFLLPPALRPCVAAFYAFVRAGDDIADNPDLPPHDKVARLDALEAALAGAPGYDPVAYQKAHRLRAALDERGVTDRHARDLLAAFRRDATKTRYDDWNDLMGYCALSAAPVGRFLLDLHQEDPAKYPASDALCAALQVLNHLQDCGDDHAELDRVYIPDDWMAAEGTGVADLAAPALTVGMRNVLERMLDATDELITHAQRLPGSLASRRLAMESAVITRIAARLSGRLRRQDPLAERVKLSKLDLAAAGAGGVWAGLTGR